MIDAVRGRLKLSSNSPDFAVSTSYRNKKSEKSAKDQRTIDRLEKELLNDLGKEENDDQD